MKNKLVLISSLAAALSAMTAGATIVDITYRWDLNKDGLIDSTEYFSAVGNTNNSLAGTMTLLGSPAIDGTKIDLQSTGSTAIFDQPLSSYIGVYGDRYAILKWGSGRLGSGGVSSGYWQVFDTLGGGTINITTPPKVGNVSVGALSYLRTVPDGGSTVMLLGAALSVIAVARRKFGV